MQVTDRPSPDAPSLTQAIIVQMAPTTQDPNPSDVFMHGSLISRVMAHKHLQSAYKSTAAAVLARPH